MESDETKKKVGITCDNYKLEKFKKELEEKGFTDYELFPYAEGTKLTLIKVNCWEADYPVIGRICEAVEAHFKAMKN